MNYYNEIDPNAAAWLRELIKSGEIPAGEVDERSIEDVAPADLAGFRQCHFFAGIGGWPLALRLAGWPDDREIWTGSCPCQPFSAAGKGAGFDDDRHLWPDFRWLIDQRRPPVVVGEQVASKLVDDWLDVVLADLEGLGFAVGAVAFPAAGVGAPHLRDRTFWLGHAYDARSQGHAGHGGTARWPGQERPAAPAGVSGGLADAGVPVAQQLARPWAGPGKAPGAGAPGQPDGRGELDAGLRSRGPVNGHWGASDWLSCRDGKWRPVEPGTFPLAHGLPARVGRLRGYGNAIVPQAAAEFIRAAFA